MSGGLTTFCALEGMSLPGDAGETHVSEKKVQGKKVKKGDLSGKGLAKNSLRGGGEIRGDSGEERKKSTGE